MGEPISPLIVMFWFVVLGASSIAALIVTARVLRILSDRGLIDVAENMLGEYLEQQFRVLTRKFLPDTIQTAPQKGALVKVGKISTMGDNDIAEGQYRMADSGTKQELPKNPYQIPPGVTNYINTGQLNFENAQRRDQLSAEAMRMLSEESRRVASLYNNWQYRTVESVSERADGGFAMHETTYSTPQESLMEVQTLFEVFVVDRVIAQDDPLGCTRVFLIVAPNAESARALALLAAEIKASDFNKFHTASREVCKIPYLPRTDRLLPDKGNVSA